MDPFLIGAAVFTALISLGLAFRRGADDANWELRWRGLDPDHRDWLAAMTTSHTWMKTLTDPEEIELARGFVHRESRRGASFDLAAVAVFAFALALVLTGILPTRFAATVFFLFTSLRVIAGLLRRQQLKRRSPEPTDPDVAPSAPSPQESADLADRRTGAVA